MAKEEDERTERVNNARRALKANPHFDVIRTDIIKFRMEAYKKEALKPADSQSELLKCERAKGAIVALEGLEFLFDAIVPTVEEEEPDASPLGPTV